MKTNIYSMTGRIVGFFLLCIFTLNSRNGYAQACAFLDAFESSTVGQTTFTSGANTFNIQSLDGTNTFSYNVFTGAGWGGAAVDNVYIDNINTVDPTVTPKFSIKSTSSTFSVKSFWMYCSDNNSDLTVTGSVTVVGKLAGATVFTVTKSSGFNTDAGTSGGYTLFDFSTAGLGTNIYSIIDEIQITGGGAYSYLALDAFSWVKAGAIPIATTSAATSVTSTSATLNGSVTGNVLSTTTSFDFSTSPTLSSGVTTVAGTPLTVSATSGTAISTNISGLTPGTTYYYRASGLNCGTTGERGSIMSFTTQSSVANIAPTFVVAGNTITLCQNAPATDFKDLMHVSDADASQTETWSLLSAPTHGVVAITSATASSGTTNITPGGTMTYQPTTGYIGSDTFSVKVSDGTDTAYKWVYVSNPGPNPIGVTGLTTVCATAFIAHGINSVTGSPSATYTWTSSNSFVGTINSATGTMGGVQGSAPATTTVTATSNLVNGCVATVFVVNTVYPLSDPGVISPHHPTVCVGDSIHLTSSSTSTNSFYGHSWSSAVTSVATVRSASAYYYGVSAGTAKITYTVTGCGNFRTFDTITVLALPSITLSTSPSVAAGSTTANLDYTGTTGSPTTYSLVYDAAAHTAGFTDVTNAAFTASPFALVVPAGAPLGVYNGTITVGNGSCNSTSVPFTVTVQSGNTAPVFVNGSSYTIPVNVCQNSNGININQYLHVNDTNVGQTLTWTELSAPDRCGTLSITGATASAGTANVTPGGQIIYTPAVAFTGTETFVVQVSDGTASANITVSVNVAAVTGSVVSTTNVSCNGGSNGAATVSVSGTSGTVTYNWAPGNPTGDGTATVSGLTAGAYTVSASDTGGCAIDIPVTITQPDALTATTSQTNIACNGGSNGAVSVTASGGTTPYSYSWSPSGGTSSSATGLVAGSYTCTITDNNSCTLNKTFTITQPTTLSATNTSQVSPRCNNSSDGSAVVTASGGVGPYSYSWAPSGGTTATGTGLGIVQYTVTVTDANSCETTALVNMSGPPILFANITSQTNITCNGGSDGMAIAQGAAGSGPYTYSWSPSGGTTNTATGLSAGVYTVTVTDAHNCTKTTTANITQPAAITATIGAQTNVSCSGGSNGSASLNVSGGSGSLSFSWSPVGGTSSFATGLSAGSYTVTIEDIRSCSATKVVTITEPAVLTASITATTDVSCNGGSNGSSTVAVAGGTTPYSYSWSPSGGTNATGAGLAAGNYTVTVTDAKNCTASTTAIIGEPPAITASITATTNELCHGGNNGSATVTASGGTGTLTYAWLPAGGNLATASGLTARTYSVTVKDDNLCSVMKTTTITEPTAITSSVSAQTNIDCNGNNTGAATISASGGTGTLVYSWAPSGGSLATATGLVAGNYSVTITDDNSCAHTQLVTITQPAVLNTSISAQTNVTCNGGTNGTATVLATGGTTPYSYSWAPTGGSAATANGLVAGSYTCTVSDNNGCTHNQVVAILEPALPVASISGTTSICKDQNANVIINGPSGTTVAYMINSGGDLDAIMNVNGADTINTGALNASATYTLLSMTSGVCTYTSTGTATVTVKAFPDVTPVSDQIVCNGFSTSGVVFTGAVSGSAFNWTNNNTGIGLAASGTDSVVAFTAINTTSAPITSTIIVTPSANACIGINDTFTITVNPTPDVVVPSNQTTCNNSSIVALNFTSGVSGTTYTWSNSDASINLANTGTGNIASFTATNATADPVTATISVTPTANSCVGTAQSFSVTVNPTPRLSSTLTPTAICDSTSFSYIPTSATSGTTFNWTRIADESFNNATASGTDNPNEVLYLSGPVSQNANYVYTLSANGCVDTQQLAVIVNPVPSLTSSLNPSAVCNASPFIYTPLSATPGVSYIWSRAAVAGISNIAASGSGNISDTLVNTTTDPIAVTYVYTLSANSCSRMQYVTVTVNPTPVFTSTLTAEPICNNTVFNYTPTSAIAGTNFAWSRSLVSGISNVAASGNNNPAETLVNTTVAPIVVTYVYTITANSCANIQNVAVTVNPTPMLTSTLTAAPVCNNTVFNYTPTSATAGTSFVWSRSSISGISNLAASGNDNPAETLVNTTTDPIVVTYVYTLTANSCTNIQNVAVTVNPTPVLTSTLTAAPVCNSTVFNYTPLSATAGTSYSWSRSAVSGLSNIAASGNDNPAETLINITTDPVVATYVYTLTANSCSNIQNVAVTVYPTPVLSSTLTAAPICNNTIFNYSPTSATIGTAFTWSRASVTGISNSEASGNDNPAEVLNNTTADPIVVVYVYTLTANGCANTQGISVTVNPTPILTSTLTASPVCDSSLFSYIATSATSGTSYSWSRAAQSGISNAASSGVGDPMEYLINTTPDPVTVTYIDTLAANGCINTQPITVTVYPKPLLSTTLSPAAICNNTTFNYSPASATTGTHYIWSRDLVTGISNPANADNTDPAEILNNTTTAPIAVTYVYTLTANGCVNTQNVVVVVNPTPVLISTLTSAPVCDSSLFSYTSTSATLGTSFTWSRAAVVGISNAASSGTGNPAEYLVNTTPEPITVAYIDTLTANGCINTQTVSVIVNPKPLLSTTLTSGAICDSSVFSYIPASATAGATFSWSRAVVVGIANAAATGVDNPAETLYNTTANPVTVTYMYTLTANGCTNTQAVAVIVNPTPKLTSSLTPAAVCNNTVFNYLPTSATVGTTFSWSRAAVSGISNLAATGVDNPAETLVNTTVNQVTVNYVYTLTANGCSFTQVVSVVVNPTPQLSGTTLATVCSNAPLSYHPTSATTVSSFAWTRPVVAGISNAAGTGSGDINELLVNTTLFPKTVVYNYVLTAFGCTNPQNFTVTVNPAPAAPVITINSPSTVCSNTMYQNFGTTPATDSVKYTWTAIGATVYAEGAGHQNSLVNFTTPGTADVILSANINGIACYTRDTFTATVGSAAALNPEVYYVHDHFICLDNTVDSYQWGYDDATTLDSTIYTGEVDQNFHNASPDFTTKKYWVITTKGGCMSKSYYNAPVGIVNVSNVDAVTIDVFPNPASDNVAIAINGINVCNTTIELTDITGKIIVKTSAVDNKTVINVGDIASGVYIVSCYHNGTKVGTTKLVKN